MWAVEGKFRVRLLELESNTGGSYPVEGGLSNHTDCGCILVTGSVSRYVDVDFDVRVGVDERDGGRWAREELKLGAVAIERHL